MRVYEYHTALTVGGRRIKTHPVSIVTRTGGTETVRTAFLIDEPGRFDEKKWNVHADGCDHPCDTREEAIRKGAEIMHQPWLDGPDPHIVIVFRNRPSPDPLWADTIS